MGAVREDRLVEITCDEDGCNASIKPHSTISESGWVKVEFAVETFAECSVRYYCPKHAPRIGRLDGEDNA